MFHPATLLLVWAGFAFALSGLPLDIVGALLFPVLILAAWLARRRALMLLRRTRWLLLSIAVLFAFATPGLLVPGPLGALGMTQDGLMLGAEHVARLVILLATLALLHEHLRTRGFVGGLYWLLAPLAHWRGLRDRIVVRLMLVVEFIENDHRGGWKYWLNEHNDNGPDSLPLDVTLPRWRDRVAVIAVTCALVALAW